MKRGAFYAGLIGLEMLLSLGGFAFSQKLIIESQWAASSIKVDGRDEEWRSDKLYAEKKPSLEYAFRNDCRNLYVLFVFKNPKSLSSIAATGMTIYCLPEGIKQKKYGVRFIQKIATADEFVAVLENQGRLLTEEDKSLIRTRSLYPIPEAYAVDNKGEIIMPAGSQPDVEPPTFRAAKQEKIVTYEFRIPLVSREPYPAGIDSEPGKTIEILFEWGGSTKETLRAKGSWQSPESLKSKDVNTGAGETRAQEFLSDFDAMSSPTLNIKKHSFRVDVKLALRQ
jgi:hypothetical protein